MSMATIKAAAKPCFSVVDLVDTKRCSFVILHVPCRVPYRGAVKGPRSDKGKERLTWILGALVALALFGIIALTFGM